MELLVPAIVAARDGYQQEETLISPLAQFRPLDLRDLIVDSKRRSIVRAIASWQESLVTQVASYRMESELYPPTGNLASIHPRKCFGVPNST
jgi:hypothetical protein